MNREAGRTPDGLAPGNFAVSLDSATGEADVKPVFDG
jgi:hypothetical protein